MINYDTLIPYHVIDYKGIQYSTCRDYSHISRYRCLRTVSHQIEGSETEQFITLETPNSIHSKIDVKYYFVRASEENRLDLIAYKYLGSASYAWVIAYLNGIEDGYTVSEGQRLMIPASKSVTDLFGKDEMLAPINPLLLNLGSE